MLWLGVRQSLSGSANQSLKGWQNYPNVSVGFRHAIICVLDLQSCLYTRAPCTSRSALRYAESRSSISTNSSAFCCSYCILSRVLKSNFARKVLPYSLDSILGYNINGMYRAHSIGFVEDLLVLRESGGRPSVKSSSSHVRLEIPFVLCGAESSQNVTGMICVRKPEPQLAVKYLTVQEPGLALT